MALQLPDYILTPVTYAFTVRAIVAFLIAYFLLGAMVFQRTPTDEKYPFFAWSLFWKVPPRTAKVNTIRITMIDGIALKTPLLSNDARERIDPAKVDNLNYFFSELARTHYLQDKPAMANVRKRIERNMPPGTAYDLLEMDIDTVAFWKSGDAGATRVLQSFTSQ